MKKRGSILLIGLCGLLIFFLAESEQLKLSARQGLTLCAESVIPALFPVMVVSSLLISCGFGEWVAPHLAGLMTPLFRLPGAGSSALILGLVGGYPIGAKTAAELCQTGALTRDEASRLLTFCNNSNPVFLISVLGQGVFGSVRVGMWLWLIHLLSALLTGLVFRSCSSGGKHSPPLPIACRAVRLPTAFVEAVGQSTRSMVSICGFVVLFYVLSAPLARLGGLLGAALVGTLELFSLVPLLSADYMGFILASACTAWGGLSVACQTASALEGTGLSIRWCLTGKLVQTVIAAALAAVVWSWL